MLVCHCNVVSDRAIRAAVQGGACDVDDVVEHCGAGADCGGCIPSIEALLAEAELAVSDPAAVAALQAERRCTREVAPHECDVAPHQREPADDEHETALQPALVAGS